jgi:Branched-chain amino acid transport protein (AzlD)
MSNLPDGPGFYLMLLLAGTLATEVWRWLGLAVGSNLDVTSAAFQWVRAVATTLVAGMVTRMVLFPAGALANVPLAIRLGAFAGGLALYVLLRRNLAAGVAGGSALLAAAQLLFG